MKQCYLCGEKLVKNRNESKDHVPPDCIFPKNKPPNLITVPCCKKCNKEYQQLDEKMRNYFAILADEKSSSVGQIAQKVILGSRKWRKEFLSYTREHPTLLDDNGNRRLLFYFDDNELKTWLIRVVKGISYHFNKKRISDTAIFKVWIYPQFIPQPSDTFPMEKGLEFRPYFEYRVIHKKKMIFGG